MPIFELIAFGLITLGGSLAVSRSNCKSCTTSARNHNKEASSEVISPEEASSHAVLSSGIDDVEGEEKEGGAEPDQSASSVAAAGSRSVASAVECCRYLTASGANHDLLQDDGDVAEGGFGSVTFYSTKSEPKQRFALKTANDTPAGRRQMMREVVFFRGLRTLAPLRNVVRIEEVVHWPKPMLLMRREEATLADMLQSGETINVDAVARILDGVLSGVEGLHNLGFFHRDIKPENILVEQKNRGILVDFGLCLKTEETRRGQGVGDGTPEYAAPETRIRGWTLNAEIYSVFACFTEAILGRCPFGGEELLLVKEERVADIEGQYEDAQADVSDYSEEVEEASAAEDLEELRHELQAASEKLNTIRVKMMRLQLDVGSWVPDEAALAELDSMGEPLSFFLPSAAEEDDPSRQMAACREAKSRPNMLFEDDWVNWLPSLPNQDMKEEITRAMDVVLSAHALDPDPGSRPQSIQMARKLLRAAATAYKGVS